MSGDGVPVIDTVVLESFVYFFGSFFGLRIRANSFLLFFLLACRFDSDFFFGDVL